MPIFEYRCRTCKCKFEKLVCHAGNTVICPGCHSTDITKLFSAFAARSGDRTLGSSCAG